jgi:electron transport complex protein RnfC
VHPDERKQATCALPIERMPFVREYVLPLSQHIGAPSKPVVEAGARVRRGQLIAEPAGFVSTALHAPVTGRVRAVELRLHPSGRMMPAVVIEADAFDSQRLPEVEPVVINGCECEPYLTCDHRLMVERAGAALRGTEIMMAQLGAERGSIGVESNKPDAIEALRAVAPPNVDVVALDVKYPQGAEKLLIDAIFDEQVPAGALPVDLGIVVNNVGTTVALADLFDRGVPLIERVVTVTGPAVARPRNLRVPLGTPLSAVIEHCGGLRGEVREVVLGGPMMGMAQKSLDVPIVKGSSGVLCLDRGAVRPRRELPCIRCGRCLDACPMFLNPARLAQTIRAERVEELDDLHLASCFECAACSFVCPSGIPLVQWMRMGKALLRDRKRPA